VLKKIYILYQSEDSVGYSFVALAGDGTCLSSWVSESEALAKGEVRSAERLDIYQKHYPEGYEFVWRGGPINHETTSSPNLGIGGSRAFIEGRLYAEFLRALTC